MKSEINLMTMNAMTKTSQVHFIDHFLEILPTLATRFAPKGTTIEAICWIQDPYVNAFHTRLITASDDSGTFTRRFNVNTGLFRVIINSEEDYSYQPIPWLEKAIRELHNDFTFLMSQIFYITKEGEELRFTFVSKMISPRYNLDEDEDFQKTVPNIYVPVFDHYFRTGEIANEHAHKVAKLLLLAVPR